MGVPTTGDGMRTNGDAGCAGAPKGEPGRRVAEEAPPQEQFLLQTLMTHTPDFIYFKDRDSRFIRISKALAGIFGLSDPAQAVGKTDFDFFTQEHAREAYEDEQTVLRTGQPLTKEERETWAERPDTWVSTTKVPLYDEAGNAIGTFGISRDITARKVAEADRERLIGELRDALSRVKTLSGMIPICAACKKIRDDGGYWNQIESYLREHSEAEFSHGLCPECMARLYPDVTVPAGPLERA
jgi:PAS domain S-box-containing protein